MWTPRAPWSQSSLDEEVRTFPTEFGHSTSVVTTDAPDVRALGRDVVVASAWRLLAKLDFKRAPDGRLVLIEANPNDLASGKSLALEQVGICRPWYIEISSDCHGRRSVRPAPA